MSEVFLTLGNLLFGIAILAYFYFREIHTQKTDPTEFYLTVMENQNHLQIQQFESLTQLSKTKDELFQKTLIEYLKHNERLEKMILPQPVTKQAVQDVLNNMPEMVPNEIEKNDKELEMEQLNDLLGRIPITKDTKIKFEGDDLTDSKEGPAEEVYSDSGTFPPA